MINKNDVLVWQIHFSSSLKCRYFSTSFSSQMLYIFTLISHSSFIFSPCLALFFLCQISLSPSVLGAAGTFSVFPGNIISEKEKECLCPSWHLDRWREKARQRETQRGLAVAFKKMPTFRSHRAKHKKRKRMLIELRSDMYSWWNGIIALIITPLSRILDSDWPIIAFCNQKICIIMLNGIFNCFRHERHRHIIYFAFNIF